MTDTPVLSTSDPSGTSPVGRRAALLKTIGYYAAFIALGMASASLGPTLPALAEHTRSSLSQISALFVARSLGYLAGSLLGGRLYDRIPGHPVMGGGLLLMAGMMGLAPVVPHLWMLAAAILVLGLAEGALDVGGNTLGGVGAWRHRGAVHERPPLLFRPGGVPVAPHHCPGDAPGRRSDPRLLDRRGAAASGGSLAEMPAEPCRRRRPRPQRSGPETHGRLVALIVLFFFLYTGAEIAFGGWIYSYAVALRLTSDTVAAYLTSTFWGALTVGRLLAVPLAIRFPPRTVLLADCLGCLASLGLVLLGSRSLVATFVGTCGVGLSMASIFPAALSLAQGRMRITGAVTGWFFVGASAGGMVLPWLIGQFFESVGPRATMVILLVDMAAAVGVLAVLTFQSARPVYHWIAATVSRVSTPNDRAHPAWSRGRQGRPAASAHDRRRVGCLG